jgi:hypothetical protein
MIMKASIMKASIMKASRTMKTSKMVRGRKAQFYIFTAIVLIAYALLTLQSTATGSTISKNFKNLYDNFVFESATAINNALAEQEDVNAEYEKFLDSFISYSKMKKLNVEVISLLETGDTLYISNHMQSSVRIININQTLDPGATTALDRSDLSEAVLEVRDDVFHENIYKFSISNAGTDAKAVLKVRTGDNREIFVQE